MNEKQRRADLSNQILSIVSRCNGVTYHYSIGGVTPVEIVQSYEQGLKEIKELLGLGNLGEEMITVNKKEYKKLVKISIKAHEEGIDIDKV